MASSEDRYSFPISEARKIWQRLTENDRVRLHEEFSNLRKMDPTRVNIGRDPMNKWKNRFALIYPYDENFCRVRLQTETNVQSDCQSDYINASIIRCVPPDQIAASTSRVFYAAQGPIERTLDDFIRMIVEQKIEIITMLSFTYDPITCLYAQEHAAYFSERVNGLIETKSYRIRTTQICSSYRYIVRRLDIECQSTNVVHVCEQFHYPHFVDKGTPQDCHSLLGLVRKLREPSNRNRRILVHCSAGIGRTGVFIALCYLLDAFERQPRINVKQVIDTIRLYRAHLVQTVDQYEYIYRCLAEVAIHPCDGRTLEEFLQCSKKLLSDVGLKDSLLVADFKNRNLCVKLQSDLTTISAEQNSKYNRNKIFVPYDRNRVMLYSPSESTYINASTIPNIVGPKHIILTQEPMENCLQPFFSMLLQEHKTFVVAVEQMETTNYTSSNFTGADGIEAEILSIPSSKNTIGDYHRWHKLKVRHNTVRECDVFILEYTGEWLTTESNLPKNLEQFVRFVDRSIYHQRRIDPTRLNLAVHDREGGTKAAFYCIVQNLLDRLLIDGKVAMENFVTDVCQQRMNAIMSLEQYTALYEIITIWNRLKHRGALECIVDSFSSNKH